MRTVVLSSHLLGEVEQICDRIGVIRGGRLVAEGSIDELRGGSHLLVRASPLEKARSVLEREVGAENVSSQDGGLTLSVSPDRTAELNATLVHAGVAVSELRPGSRSLEDVFMELTGTEAGL